MPANLLPLVNLRKPLSPALTADLRSALRQYGAFRLAAPQNTRYHLSNVFQNAGKFFQQLTDVKKKLKGYSPFASESVRGRTAFPKESIYFFRDGAEPEDINCLGLEFYHSVKALYEEWTPIRLQLLETISQTLDASTPLTGTALLDSATLGVHYYDSRTLHSSTYFSPSHMDSGTLTILFRSHNKDDGLEIADLQTTKKKGSEEIGSEASFIPVPTASDEVPEVIVFAGTRLQSFLGSDRVRACVHRVRGPGAGGHNNCGVQRLSIAMFCAPSVPPALRSPPLASS